MAKDKLPVRYPAKVLVVDAVARKVLILQLEGKERAMRGIDEWHIPGGSFEEGQDSNLEEAGVREVKEETGLTVKIKKTLGEATHFEATFFLAERQQDSGEVVVDENEADDVAWVDEETMYNYIGLTPEAKKFIPLVLREYPI